MDMFFGIQIKKLSFSTRYPQGYPQKDNLKAGLQVDYSQFSEQNASLMFQERIFSYCRGIPKSQLFEACIMACRSSIFFPVTLTKSSLMEA